MRKKQLKDGVHTGVATNPKASALIVRLKKVVIVKSKNNKNEK